MLQPVLKTNLDTELLWSDEFDGDLSQWRDDELVISAKHRTGNKYIQPDGTIDPTKDWHKLPGRWAALYNDYRKECQYTENGNLVMKGHAVEAANPYRDNFTDGQGMVHEYGDYMLYTSWLTSLHDIERGSVIEVRVNLEDQAMRGHRWNFWMMPKEGDAYDSDPSRGEIDMPEVENPSRIKNFNFGQHAMLVVLGGKAGNTQKSNIDLFDDFGINLREGWHTFTTVWGLDGSIEFYVDGILCNRDDRAITMTGELILAREMNSGVKAKGDKAWENYSVGPKMPPDPGLTAQSVIMDLDLIDDDMVLIDYVRVWKIKGELTEPKQPVEPPSDKTVELESQVKALSVENDQLKARIEKARMAVKTLLEI